MIILRKFVNRLLSGCWLQHEHLVYSRDADHRLVRYCTACRLQYPILASPIVKGPKLNADPILGTPNQYAQRSGGSKVRSIALRSQRP